MRPMRKVPDYQTSAPCRARLISTKPKRNPMMKKWKKRKRKKKKESRGIMAVLSMKQVSDGRAYLSRRWKKVGR